MSNYWLRRKDFSRRQVLRGAAAGSIGLAGLSIVGCGDDSSTSTPAASTSPTAATTTAPTGTSTPASAANATAFETPSFTPAPNAGGTLVWGMESDIDPLDPTTQLTWIVWRINYQIYESLVTRNLLTDELNPTIVPRLAKTWEQPDELTYIFRLQEGVKFHDGADFNAEAVKFNYLRGTDETHPNYFAAADTTGLRYIYQFTERVDTPDPMTVTFVNNRPFFDFLEIQSAFQFPGLISPKAIQEFGSEAIGKQHPIGTGPYRVKEQAAGERYVLEKNPDYWGMPGNLQEIIFRPIPDNQARVTALQTNEVDLIFVPPVDSLEQLTSSGYNVLQGPTPHVWYMYLNLHKDSQMMNDIRVRKALQMAFDKEGISNTLMKGTVIPAHQHHTPGAPAYDPNYKLYNYDPAEARKLLTAAGFENGFETSWQFPSGGSGNLEPVAIAEWMQADLKELGINITTTFTEWITYLSNTFGPYPNDPNQSAWSMSWGMSQNYYVNILAHSQWLAPDWPNFWWVNKDFDAICDKAQVEPDPLLRNQLYRDANNKIMEEAVLIPIVHDLAPIAMSTKVQGFIHAAEEAYDLRPVWLQA